LNKSSSSSSELESIISPSDNVDDCSLLKIEDKILNRNGNFLPNFFNVEELFERGIKSPNA